MITRSQEFSETMHQVKGQSVRLTTYRIGDQYFTQVDNVDPGATIARANGLTRDEAEYLALSKVSLQIN